MAIVGWKKLRSDSLVAFIAFMILFLLELVALISAFLHREYFEQYVLCDVVMDN